MFKQLIALLYLPAAMALTFDLPDDDSNVVGKVFNVEVMEPSRLDEIGRDHDIGAQEMEAANPRLKASSWVEAGTFVTIPAQFILPPGPRKGVVVNIAEMRIYHFHENGRTVSTYPIGIGMEGWGTPLGETKITKKRLHPTWVVPPGIAKKYARKGKPLPASIPPGPKNPLGDHAINLAIPGIRIHGTIYPEGIGLRSSHGCIRMLPEDVEELFNAVEVGTPVRIVHDAIKVGINGGQVLLEAHPPLREAKHSVTYKMEHIIAAIAKYAPKANVDWQAVEKLYKAKHGIPKEIGVTK